MDTSYIHPFTRLMRGLSRKDVNFRWSPELKEEFQEVKRVVSGVNVLSPYNHELHLHLYCDASREGGLGYVLVQPQGMEKTNVLQCGSTTLSSAQEGTTPLYHFFLPHPFWYVCCRESEDYFTWGFKWAKLGLAQSPKGICDSSLFSGEGYW